MCDFGSGMCLPYKSKFHLRLQLGSRIWDSGAPKETKNKYCRWDSRIDEEFTDSYQNLKRFPSIFVYLMDGDKPVCFWRESVLSFMNPETNLQWF